MPGFDGTGPDGQGPISGRGRGGCTGQSPRLRFWDRSGFGRGRGNRFLATGMSAGFRGRGRNRSDSILSQQEELEMLEEDAKHFERELKNIREDIELIKKMDLKE